MFCLTSLSSDNCISLCCHQRVHTSHRLSSSLCRIYAMLRMISVKLFYYSLLQITAYMYIHLIAFIQLSSAFHVYLFMFSCGIKFCTRIMIVAEISPTPRHLRHCERPLRTSIITITLHRSYESIKDKNRFTRVGQTDKGSSTCCQLRNRDSA